jgi:hypothetical protein
MVFLRSIVLVCFLTGTVLAGDRQFVEQWKNYDEQIQVSRDLDRLYEKKIRKHFYSLTEYEGQLTPPPGVDREIEDVLLLYSQENMSILLATPKNVMKNRSTLNEDYKKARTMCGEDKSWLVLLPENAWSEVDLNPYCTMDYDEEGILFDLYWTGSTIRPFVDIVTNGLTCVPHRLYGWARKTGRYEPIAVKCTGLRTVEGYPGTGSRLDQLF